MIESIKKIYPSTNQQAQERSQRDQNFSSNTVAELFHHSIPSSAYDVSLVTPISNRNAQLGGNIGRSLGFAAVLSGIMGGLNELGYAAGFSITHTLGQEFPGAPNHFIYQFPAGIDHLMEFFKAGDPKEVLDWVVDMVEPRLSFYPWAEKESSIGIALGTDGEMAFNAACAWLPILFMDSALVVSGMQLRNRSPFLGNLLVASGLCANTMYSTSSSTAVMTSLVDPEALQGLSAQNPGSVERFVVSLSAATGISPEVIAISTASIWTLFVPLVAIAAYMHSKSRNIDLVPEGIAIKLWLQKAKNDPKIAEQLQTYWEKYPKKADLQDACAPLTTLDGGDLPTAYKIEKMQKEIDSFVGYLLETMPSSSLDLVKKEMAEEWGKKVCTDKIQTGLAAASVVGSVSSVAAKTLSFFAAATGSFSMHLAASVLTHISPLFVSASAFSAGYQVYKDFQCPDEKIPKVAKMLSIARLIASTATATLVISALFIPGVHVLLFASLLIGSIVNITLFYARTRAIRKQFEYLQAAEPNTWNVMSSLWRDHREKPKGTPMSPRLKKWVKCLGTEGISKIPFWTKNDGIEVKEMAKIPLLTKVNVIDDKAISNIPFVAREDGFKDKKISNIPFLTKDKDVEVKWTVS